MTEEKGKENRRAWVFVLRHRGCVLIFKDEVEAQAEAWRLTSICDERAKEAEILKREVL